MNVLPFIMILYIVIISLFYVNDGDIIAFEEESSVTFTVLGIF